MLSIAMIVVFSLLLIFSESYSDSLSRQVDIHILSHFVLSKGGLARYMPQRSRPFIALTGTTTSTATSSTTATAAAAVAAAPTATTATTTTGQAADSPPWNCCIFESKHFLKLYCVFVQVFAPRFWVSKRPPVYLKL